jgi:hypothetical protein
MIHDLDAEVELLRDEIGPASPHRSAPVPDEAAFCADCGEPNANRSWMGSAVCSACWVERSERAEVERQERLERRRWEPKIRRMVPLGLDAEAKFVIWPEPRMVVIRRGHATVFLEYFDPTGYSTEALKKKLGVYQAFS